MSMTITNNPDGTLTITCGGDTVTIGEDRTLVISKAASFKPQEEPKKPKTTPWREPAGGGTTAGGGGEIPAGGGGVVTVIPPGGGGAAAYRRKQTQDISAATQTKDILAAMRSRAKGSAENTPMQFHWEGDAPLDVHRVVRDFYRLGAREDLRCEVVLPHTKLR